MGSSHSTIQLLTVLMLMYVCIDRTGQSHTLIFIHNTYLFFHYLLYDIKFK